MIPCWAYVTGVISSVLFLAASLPDIITTIKSTHLAGATWKSPAITACALCFAIATNIAFHNWPFVFSDGVGVILLVVLAYKRYKLSKQ